MVMNSIIDLFIAIAQSMTSIFPQVNFETAGAPLIGLNAAFYWMVEADKFFPVSDGLIPIVLLSGTYLTTFLTFKGVKTVINIVRGSGA